MNNPVVTAPSLDERVLQIVAEQAQQPRETLNRETSLHEIFDSLDYVEVTMALEDEFELAISDADADRVLTIGQMIDLIADKLSTQRAPDPHGDTPPSP